MSRHPSRLLRAFSSARNVITTRIWRTLRDLNPFSERGNRLLTIIIAATALYLAFWSIAARDCVIWISPSSGAEASEVIHVEGTVLSEPAWCRVRLTKSGTVVRECHAFPTALDCHDIESGEYEITVEVWRRVLFVNLRVQALSRRVVLDKEPPEIVVTGVGESRGSTQSLEARIVVQGGVIEHLDIDGRLQNAAMGREEQSITAILEDLDEGQHLITVTAIDEALNRRELLHGFRIDNTAPTVTGLSVDLSRPIRQAISILPIVSEADCSLDVWLDGSSLEDNPQFDVDTTELTDGPHSISVRAIDKAGNETTAEFAFLVDNTPPRIGWLPPFDRPGAVVSAGARLDPPIFSDEPVRLELRVAGEAVEQLRFEEMLGGH